MTSASINPIMDNPRYLESHVVTLLKSAGRRLDESTIKTQMDSIIAGTITGQRAARGWSASIAYRPIDTDSEWDMSRVKPLSADETFYTYSYVPETSYAGHFEYRVDILLSLDAERQRESVRAELEGIVVTMHARGQYPKWNVEKLDGAPFTVKAPTDYTRSIIIGGAAQVDSADAIGYAPCIVPSNWDSHFTHLFGLDDQIGMVKAALDAAITTGWAKRFHTKLIGPPGCGKSAILSAAKNAVGADSVLEFDATATTAAGAMQMLEEFEELPRVLVVEELEKAPTDTFQFLLGLMDDRSEIRKVTARKKIFRETKLLTFATVNDESLLDKAMGGALSSRFSQPIYFNRPSRDLLARILMREINAYGGDDTWIDPTLDLVDVLGISDPRRVISICLLGRNDLITGEYQRRLLSVGLPHHDDMTEDPNALQARLKQLVSKIQDGAA